jgi:S-DNA-T family DNA segregation ATPase FtsK/SpoIIIE
VAGATNSGKSVFMQALILSIIYRNTPDEVKFLFIDPKRLELTFYEDIPYLYDPKETPDKVSVITDPKEAAKSLLALTRVMEKRYIKFQQAKVKNIAAYNKWAAANGEPQEYYIIVVIDELADLILQVKNVVEDAIQRLAQMARAVGIHLVLATQRPSVDVITGVIKANLPSRVALQVTSKTDSRVILDTPGAESLIGRGDLLYLAIDAQKPVRIQGAYVSEDEIRRVADYLRAQARPHYTPLVEEEDKALSGSGGSSEELINAMRLILERRRVSQDLLKAHFGSSARATNLLSILETNGFIRKPEGSNRWEIDFDKIGSHIDAESAPEPLEQKEAKETVNEP